MLTSACLYLTRSLLASRLSFSSFPRFSRRIRLFLTGFLTVAFSPFATFSFSRETSVSHLELPLIMTSLIMNHNNCITYGSGSNLIGGTSTFLNTDFFISKLISNLNIYSLLFVNSRIFWCSIFRTFFVQAEQWDHVASTIRAGDELGWAPGGWYLHSTAEPESNVDTATPAWIYHVSIRSNRRFSLDRESRRRRADSTCRSWM